MRNPPHVQPARAYLGGAQQPLAVGHGGGGGLSALAGLLRSLGLPPSPNAPQEQELQPEGHSSGRPGPVHGAQQLQTPVAAQPGERVPPGVLMGAAVQPALRAPCGDTAPGGTSTPPCTCRQGEPGAATQAPGWGRPLQGHTPSRSPDPPGWDGRPPPSHAVPRLPARARRQINPPLRPKAPRGRAHTLRALPANRGSPASPGAETGALGCGKGLLPAPGKQPPPFSRRAGWPCKLLT